MKKHAEHPSKETTTKACILLIQEITTWWTKASRGADRATLRTAVPQALSLPTSLHSVSEPTLLSHQVRYDEKNDFRVPLSSTLSTQPFHQTLHRDNIVISLNQSVAQIHLGWIFGTPRRHSVHNILTIAPSEWGQVCFNYRYTTGDGGPWRYALWVFNIGLFFTCQPDIFQVT